MLKLSRVTKMLGRLKMANLYSQVTPKGLSVITPKDHFAVALKDTRGMAEYIFVCCARSLFAGMLWDICSGYVKGRVEGGASGDIFGRAVRFRSPAPSAHLSLISQPRRIFLT